MGKAGQESQAPGAKAVSKVLLSVPGSSANIGPGFDTFALALSLYTKFSFSLLSKDDPQIPLFSFGGALAKEVSAGKDNLIYLVLSQILAGRQDLLGRLRIHVESDIPLGRGLGSSAACVAATVYAAHKFLQSGEKQNVLLKQASKIEGHPDNVAASFLGGFVISAETEAGIVAKKLNWPANWRTLVVVPKYELATSEARAVLPEAVRREDAVFNMQRAGLLIASIAQCDPEALSFALADKLHEPYREKLVPELPSLRQSLSGLPVLGCVLSGAGSSILILVEQAYKNEVLEFLQTWAGKEDVPPSVLDLKVDNKGLEEIHE